MISEIKITPNIGFSEILSWGPYLLGFGHKEKMSLMDLKVTHLYVMYIYSIDT
jgi:hypothetical protein